MVWLDWSSRRYHTASVFFDLLFLGTLPTQKNQYLREFQWESEEVKQVTRRQRRGYRTEV
eukprot:scaffold21566_cov73-Cyclotella_meneghiniana.AAC.1